MKIFKSIALFLAILFGWQFHVYAQTPTFSCTTSGSVGGLNWTCPNSTAPVVTPPVVTTPVTQPSACTASPSDTLGGGVVLTRTCLGTLNYFGISGIPNYNGPLSKFTDVWSNAAYGAKWHTFQNFFTGATFILPVPSRTFVSFAYTAPATGSIQLSAATSTGDGGAISLSTTPGQFVIGHPGVICSQNTGSGNSLPLSTAPVGSQCLTTIGTTYYINLADVDLATGDRLCFNKPRNTCDSGSSNMSYIVYVSKVQ